MNKILLSLLFAAFILTGASYAQNNPPPAAADTSAPAPAAAAPAPVATKTAHHDHHSSELHKAMHDLRLAKAHLEKDTGDYGGYKAKAIAAINEALEELHTASDSK